MHKRVGVAVAALFVSSLPPSLIAQNIGTAPQEALDAVDVYAAYHLDHKDGTDNPAGVEARTLQMWQRAAKLNLTSSSAYEAWTGAQKLQSSPVTLPASAPTPFDGTRASDLNTFLANSGASYIRITAPAITTDQSIVINRDGVTIDFGNTSVTATSSNLLFHVRIEGVHNVAILGGIFRNGNSGILIKNAANVLVSRADLASLSGGGVITMNSNYVMVCDNRIRGTQGPGIIVGAATALSTVTRNEVMGNGSGSNWTAGIVLSDRDVDYGADPQALLVYRNFGPPFEAIRDKIHPPHDCLIAWNRVIDGISQGIYADGAVRMVIVGNDILGNAKEGLCLDNGATANVVVSNIFQHNGNRWGQTDEVLTLDFSNLRLPDGTAASKLPAISLDNALYNIVYGNNISHNYGDGIKSVRTTFFNVLAQNIIESDNDGVNAYYRFFGFFIGAISADVPASDIDFTSSRGNMIFSNLIRGPHSSGMYIQMGSDQNQIFDNIIKDVQIFAIESVLEMANYYQNNMTDRPSQNAGPACCFHQGGIFQQGRIPARPPLR